MRKSDFKPSKNIKVNNLVRCIYTADKYSHIVKKIEENSFISTVCYKIIPLYSAKKDKKNLCSYCKKGRPDPNNLSEYIVKNPIFWKKYPKLAIPILIGRLDNFRKIYIK